MCGLAFLLSPGEIEAEQRARMQAALGCLQHRGPDDGHLQLKDGAVLGHRRLSIIDLDASIQPMSDPTGRFTLIYNGEIYNYQALRAELAQDWDFHTAGDTEVLLAGLIVFGKDFLNRMEGMWAFALWDTREKTVLMARDRLGKKPLYYSNSRERFSCASELPALNRLSDQAWQEDLDSTADYLRYGYYLPGTSAYQQVQEVLPAHWLVRSQDGTLSTGQYWQLPSVEPERQQPDTLRALLSDAVKIRLVGDVEVGAFLSGGIDSSLVVALMAGEHGARTKTFSMGFSEASYDERRFARLVAERYATDHYEECLTDWAPEQLQALVLDHVGQPFSDSSLLPTARVSQLAARHVKVALSGDGADELFSGYQRYQARAILRWYTRLPRMLRGSFANVIRTLPEPLKHHSGSLIKKAHLFQDVVDRLEDETPYTAPLMYSNRVFSQLSPDLVGRGHAADLMPAETTMDDVRKMMLADTLVYLPQDILLKVDRASMAASLETRAPFLDSRVVEFACAAPTRSHRRRATGKRLLRENFAGLLPDTIWKRRKQGFAVPVHQWFRGGMAEELRGLLYQHNTVLDRPFVEALLKEHQAQKRDHGYRLWNMYIYLLWNSKQPGYSPATIGPNQAVTASVCSVA